MLMNPDKHLKDNLFNYYKEDMIERRMRKEESFNTEKMHDKIYMDQIKRSNLDEKMRQQSERQKRNNDNMNDYNNFWSKKDQERRNKYNKNSDIYNENHNISISKSMSMGNMNQMANYNQINPNSHPQQSMNPDMSLVNMNKVKKDNLNHILYPEYIGIKKLSEMEKNDKNEYQKFYKNILDSQITYNTSSPSPNNYNQVVNMISNPHSLKKYQSKPSELSYNTITDPRNNITHNKYIHRFANSLDLKNMSRMPLNNRNEYNSYNSGNNYYQQPNQQYNSHIPSNDYQNYNPNIYMSPKNHGYNMNTPNNFNQQNNSGEKLRMVASNILN